LTAQLILGFTPGAIAVPKYGEYAVRFIGDGKVLGELSVLVRKAPTEN
jgi:hypothetical protein